MANKNYLSGRRFEYETMELWKKQKYSCVRTAGSHGPFDVIAFRLDRKPEFIQCKVVSDEAAAERLLNTFVRDTIPSSHYHQRISVKVKGSGKALTRTV